MDSIGDTMVTRQNYAKRTALLIHGLSAGMFCITFGILFASRAVYLGNWSDLTIAFTISGAASSLVFWVWSLTLAIRALAKGYKGAWPKVLLGLSFLELVSIGVVGFL